MKNRIVVVSIFIVTVFVMSCKNNKKEEILKTSEIVKFNTYHKDVTFMKDYTSIIELSDASGKSKVAIAAALQGRVMTSSAFGNEGRSYGWINKELFKSKDTLEHINVFGGEERFWLGPEGGQYSIFFKKGDEFTLENWYTPRLIDLEHFDVEKQSTSNVVFTKKASLKNYSGFQFDMGIEREISILSKEAISQELGIYALGNNIKAVAYQTKNTLTNLGDADWKKETGLLSIWLLGMYNHSPNTTIMIPYISGEVSELGIPVNDTYFGKVPADRLVVKDAIIYFSGDGKYRSKIGLSPMRAKDVAGSYDSKNGILTIVKYNKPEKVTDYVNSMWEIQDEPFAGDVINAYNDGEPSPGEKPLGPFYELETSSSAMSLKVGESGTHIQLTCHLEGSEEDLNPIIKKVFGVNSSAIKNAFK
ncbi:hypothetical protein SAMN05216503_0020 [Polaribacter sp. KT25b]|uniref:DUF6786 family protein n=1 Tax=Polaribacter sp. KT25b TaxID=1855336 RepID=UPI00087CA115|nr:DUF6786 family protein [Polaribacter sp. KT25b]SDR65417.1 hypothetical protein SAMN05216503_0020 [Polaribacter sp. KT25b]